MNSKLKRKRFEKVSYKGSFQSEVLELTDDTFKVTDCVNQSKDEAMLRTEDLMRLREELQDATKL